MHEKPLGFGCMHENKTSFKKKTKYIFENLKLFFEEK
jgi:hypothetical protein